MKNILIGILSILCLIGPSAMAQQDQQTAMGKRELLRNVLRDIKRADGNEVEMNNGRRYILEHGAVIEYPDLKKGTTNIRNVFDFENGLILHEDIKGKGKLAVTPFSQLDRTRINDVKNIGCYIARQSGSGNPIYADRDMTDFIRSFCQEFRRP